MREHMYLVAHLPYAKITKEMQALYGKARSLNTSNFFPGSMLSALIPKENITCENVTKWKPDSFPPPIRQIKNLWSPSCTLPYIFMVYCLIKIRDKFTLHKEWLWIFYKCILNPLKPDLNPICYLLALLGAHRFLHVSRIRVKLLTFRLLMSYIYGAPIPDVSRSHTTTQHSR